MLISQLLEGIVLQLVFCFHIKRTRTMDGRVLSMVLVPVKCTEKKLYIQPLYLLYIYCFIYIIFKFTPFSSHCEMISLSSCDIILLSYLYYFDIVILSFRFIWWTWFLTGFMGLQRKFDFIVDCFRNILLKTLFLGLSFFFN